MKSLTILAMEPETELAMEPETELVMEPETELAMEPETELAMVLEIVPKEQISTLLQSVALLEEFYYS